MRRMSWVPGLVLVASCLMLAGIPQTAAYAADTTAPTGTVIINNNRSATNNPTVRLTLTWSDGAGSGVASMRFSNDGATWSAWEPVSPWRDYTLPAGADGHRTVRVQYLDKANNRSAPFNDYIRLDTTAPTGAIIINSGASTTTNQIVTLGLSWSDGAGGQVSRMRLSDNGSTWTAWIPQTATRAHMLPTGLGYHTVRVQYLDGAGNYSSVYNDYIKLVTGPSTMTEETVMLPDNVPLVMVWIPGGTLMMGRTPGEQDSYSGEDPQHTVPLGGYWMGKYELTKRQWYSIMGTTPWSGQDHVLADLDSPALYVSWNDAESFLTVLNMYTGKTFRLPSEAQWEYACRGGAQTRFYWGDDPDYTVIGDYAWHSGNYSSEPYAHVVGLKLPSAFGLYDMSGNVWEWCEDDWHNDYTSAPTDGQAWVDSPRGSSRVLRGGSWTGSNTYCRSASRYGFTLDYTCDNLGFRVSRTP